MRPGGTQKQIRRRIILATSGLTLLLAGAAILVVVASPETGWLGRDWSLYAPAEEALQEEPPESDDSAAVLAADPTMKHAIETLQQGLRAAAKDRQNAMLLLGKEGFAEALPLITSVLLNEDESPLMRGDALHAIALIAPESAVEYAREYQDATGHLREVARRILADDRVIEERRENVRDVLSRPPLGNPETH